MYKSTSGQIVYSPSDLSTYVESHFAALMDRHYLESRELFEPDPQSAMNDLLAKRGIEFEQMVLEGFKQHGFTPVEIDTGAANRENAFAQTLDALKSERQIIYQAALESGVFKGFADFLIRDENGNWEVWDTKLAHSVKPKFIVQLCCYADMIEHLTGLRPEVIGVLLGNAEKVAMKTADYFSYYLQAKQSFLELMASFDASEAPTPTGFGKNGRWESEAQKWLLASDSLSQVAGIRQTQVKKLEAADITTMTGLSETLLKSVRGIGGEVFPKLIMQAQLQMASKNKEKPEYLIYDHDLFQGRKGLQLLPPASELDVYFDMEGYPLEKDGLEYLFGATFRLNGNMMFRDWWACSKLDEQQAFEQFIDWVYERWIHDPAMHIYHYGHYEQTALKRLMGAYATRENEIDSLLRGGVFVDLLQVVKQGICVGTPSYSIKDIERLYREAREGEVGTAEDSIIQFEQWRESGQAPDWKQSDILKDIRDYNKDDCDSTLELTEWLRKVQSNEGISWALTTEDAEAQLELGPKSDAEQLSLNMLSTLPQEVADFSEDDHLTRMLAWLLEFIRREDKPQWWNFFRRESQTAEELWEDKECLAGLVRTATPPVQIKRSLSYEYAFDPHQESKVRARAKGYPFASDTRKSIIVESVDYDTGIANLKWSAGKDAPPKLLDLVPEKPFRKSDLTDSIYRSAFSWHSEKEIHPAVRDFLLRSSPRLKNQETGTPILSGKKDLLDETVAAISDLDGSILCIQGPPGCGKTHVAAHSIVAIMKQGKRVGITSNSHKAIINLLEKVSEVADEDGFEFQGVKIGEAGRLEGNPHFQFPKGSGDWTPTNSDEVLLVGGTAWAFCREDWTDQFDYLFVDEAGQVSLAALVSISPSTRNLVVVGDQMQLDQPIQGTHPGDSSKSIMDYFLDGKATVPPEQGVLLDKSWRMHPNICQFISERVYDGRLSSETHCSNRTLVPSNTSGVFNSTESGIVYVPVEHEGNSQSSEEEVKAIEQIVRELVGRELLDKDGNPRKKVDLSDILFVAPYNMQVSLLQSRLGQEARVASVDKFQGQEAPIVVLSMCASSAEDVPRGMDFLLSKNRLNVAISRAETLAVVVGSPALKQSNCTTTHQMELANFFCALTQYSTEYRLGAE